MHLGVLYIYISVFICVCKSLYVCVCLFISVHTQIHGHEKDSKLGQFLSGVKLFGIQSFLSSRLLAWARLKNPVCSTSYPLLAGKQNICVWVCVCWYIDRNVGLYLSICVNLSTCMYNVCYCLFVNVSQFFVCISGVSFLYGYLVRLSVVHISGCTCVCIHLCMYICIYVCEYFPDINDIYIHTHEYRSNSLVFAYINVY